MDLITLAQFQGSEMSQGLFQDFMDGHINPQNSSHYWLNIVLWLWLRVPNQDDPRLNPVGSQISIPVL